MGAGDGTLLNRLAALYPAAPLRALFYRPATLDAARHIRALCIGLRPGVVRRVKRLVGEGKTGKTSALEMPAGHPSKFVDPHRFCGDGYTTTLDVNDFLCPCR